LAPAAAPLPDRSVPAVASVLTSTSLPTDRGAVAAAVAAVVGGWRRAGGGAER